MKRLIIANTFYQVIFSLQMKNTIFVEDEVDLIITDHSNRANELANSLKNKNLFSEVYFVKTNGAPDNRNNLQRLFDILSLVFFRENRFSYYIDKVRDKHFDEIIVYNYEMRIYGLYAMLSCYNSGIQVSRFEEGLLSYSTETIYTKARSAVSFLRKVVSKPIIEDNLGVFYCFYPNLYIGILKTKKIPLIESNSGLKYVLQDAFNFSLAPTQYQQKYIFFTSVYDFEGGEPVGEYELVCKIAELVGKENLLVKTHPRDTRTVYTDNGFSVDKNSAIPWEVIQLSGDFSDKVFMTLNSSSVLSGSTMSENPVRTYYMYKMCDFSGNELCKRTVRDIESLLSYEDMKEVLKTVKIAERLEDIL